MNNSETLGYIPENEIQAIPEENAELKSDNYLKRHLERGSVLKMSFTKYTAGRKLNEPIKGENSLQLEDWPKNAILEMEDEKTNYRLKYEAVSEDYQYFHSTRFDDQSAILDCKTGPNYHQEIEKYKIIQELSFLPFSGEQKRNIMNDLPEGYKVFFTPDIKLKKTAAIPEIQACFVRGDLSKPATIIALLHEIGHCIAYEHLNNEERADFAIARNRLKRERTISKKEAELILRAERDAWAYALTVIRPYLSEDDAGGFFPRQIILDHIHNLALNSHSLMVKIGLGNSWIEFVKGFLKF